MTWKNIWKICCSWFETETDERRKIPNSWKLQRERIQNGNSKDMKGYQSKMLVIMTKIGIPTDTIDEKKHE